MAGHLTEALSACPVWRWNLARGHVHWSGAMYRILGRMPLDETMAYRTIAQSLHPDDDLRASVDRHLRDGRREFDQSFRLRHTDGHWIGMRLRGHITRDKETAEPLLTAIAAVGSRRSHPRSTPMRGSATPWRPSRKPSCCGTTRTAW